MPSLAQTARLTFEVASIKAAAPDRPGRADALQEIFPGLAPGMTADAARVHIPNRTLVDLICLAYRIQREYVSFDPWMATVRFDVDAKLPEGSTRSQVPEMLKSLLEDRFELSARLDQRVTEQYAVVVKKGGARLQPHQPREAGLGDVTLRDLMSRAPQLQNGVTHNTYTGFTMDEFSSILSRLIHSPVANLTGLQGTYDIALDLSIGEFVRQSGDGDSQPPSLLESLGSLGLGLERRRLPVTTLIVDHARKTPLAN